MVGKKFMLGITIFALVLMIAGNVIAQESTTENNKIDKDQVVESEKLIFFGIAIAVGVSGIASAFGLGISGSAAAGATSEKKELGGKFLVLEVLPMTQGVYGLLAAILLLLGTGRLSGELTEEKQILLSNPAVGWAGLAIGIIIALTSISAVSQGLVASAGISGTAKNPEIFTNSMMYTVMPETLAIFGLLVSILILRGVGLLG